MLGIKKGRGIEVSIKKVWCTKCDRNMSISGNAMDCPVDGVFYICPKCGNRIVIFMEDSD